MAVLQAISDAQSAAIETPDHYPVLHLECHGLEDKTGLSMGDGTTLTWGELKTALTKLNEVTRCNLFVTLAACHGGHLFEILNVDSRAPCWGLLGPSNVVSPADLVRSYSTFFLELLKTGNPDTALTLLRNTPTSTGQYFLFTAERNFSSVFQLHQKLDRANMAERVRRFSEISKRFGEGLSNEWISSELNSAEHDVLKRFFTRYFFVDRCPENETRFLDAYLSLAKH